MNGAIQPQKMIRPMTKSSIILQRFKDSFKIRHLARLLFAALFCSCLIELSSAKNLAQEEMLRAAFDAHVRGDLKNAEAKYKSVDGDAAASSLLGILFCQTQRPDAAAPLLERAPASDWVAHEYMGGVYMLLARRLMSSNVSDNGRQRLKALKLAAREFALSLEHYTPQPAATYAQSAFAKERGVVYRAYGDALAWSGSTTAAMDIYGRGTREGLWPHGPHCRPARSRPVIGIPHHTQPGRVLFPHVALKLESAVSQIRDELETLDRIGQQNLWVQESAGLHSHGSTGSWHVLLLIVNGKKQLGCFQMPITCDLLMSLPSVQYLKDGQVKFSRIASGTHVLPHAGPTNLRLRMQLPISLQKSGDSRIRVGMQGWRTWNMGESFVFDESCEHEVVVNGSGSRTVLLVDFANPLLISQQDYTSVAMRISSELEEGGDSSNTQKMQAAKEWSDVHARWRAQEQVKQIGEM